METKILEKLKSQRGQNSQVSDKTLEIMAKRFSKYIDTDEKLEAEDFKEDIENVQGNIGHIAKQVKEDTEKKIKVEKTPEQLAAEKAAEELKAKENEKKGISPELAALMKQNEEIMKTLSGIQGEKITKTRVQSLNEALKDAPSYYKNQVLSGFENMSFKSDEDFNSYAELTKSNFTQFQQDAKEDGLNKYSPKGDPKKDNEDAELSPVFKAAMEAHDSKANTKE